MMCRFCGTINADNPGVVGTCEDCAGDVDAPLTIAHNVPGVCVGCGCTDSDPCPGGCAWTDEHRNVCTECMDTEMEAEE